MKEKIKSFPKILIFVITFILIIILGNGVLAKADVQSGINPDINVIHTKGNNIPQNVQHKSAIITGYAFYAKALHMDWNYDVYLPAGYNPKSNKKYPVIYLLNGLYGNQKDMWIYMNTERMLDQVRQKTGQPVIAVFVDGFNSYYINSKHGLQMQTALIHNLLPQVEKNYQVSKKASQTAIGGLSMGGYGASRLALKYPNKFSKVLAISPGIRYHQRKTDTPLKMNAYNNGHKRYSQKVYKKTFPTKYITKKSKKKVKFYVESTNSDTTVPIKDVRHFVSDLKKKGVSTNFVEDHGDNHNWAYWKKAFPKAYNWVINSFK